MYKSIWILLGNAKCDRWWKLYNVPLKKGRSENDLHQTWVLSGPQSTNKQNKTKVQACLCLKTFSILLKNFAHHRAFSRPAWSARLIPKKCIIYIILTSNHSWHIHNDMRIVSQSFYFSSGQFQTMSFHILLVFYILYKEVRNMKCFETLSRIINKYWPKYCMYTCVYIFQW